MTDEEIEFIMQRRRLQKADDRIYKLEQEVEKWRTLAYQQAELLSALAESAKRLEEKINALGVLIE